MKTQTHRNVAPDDIKVLAENWVFVFGSNRRGAHGRGAAKTALKWGARPGQGEGLSGKTYALSTKDAKIQTLPLGAIAINVDRFVRFAASRLDLTFLVTAIGCGLAGYSSKEIAPLFFTHVLPPNVFLPERFWDVYDQS